MLDYMINVYTFFVKIRYRFHHHNIHKFTRITSTPFKAASQLFYWREKNRLFDSTYFMTLKNSKQCDAFFSSRLVFPPFNGSEKSPFVSGWEFRHFRPHFSLEVFAQAPLSQINTRLRFLQWLTTPACSAGDNWNTLGTEF